MSGATGVGVGLAVGLAVAVLAAVVTWLIMRPKAARPEFELYDTVPAPSTNV
jgi:hypothetical protein